MRHAFVAIVLLLSAAVASAQSTSTTRPWRLTLFASDVGFTYTNSYGSDVSGGLGLGLAYAHNERWSTEFAIAAQRYNTVYTEFRPLAPGTALLVPYTTHRDFLTFPVSVTSRYHFVNRSRWTPFVLAGVRHVQAPERGPTFTVVGAPPIPATFQPVTEGFILEDRTSGEAGGGVILGLTDRVGLMLEGRHLLRSDGAPHDPLMRVSVGVSWKF